MSQTGYQPLVKKRVSGSPEFTSGGPIMACNRAHRLLLSAGFLLLHQSLYFRDGVRSGKKKEKKPAPFLSLTCGVHSVQASKRRGDPPCIPTMRLHHEAPNQLARYSGSRDNPFVSPYLTSRPNLLKQPRHTVTDQRIGVGRLVK